VKKKTSILIVDDHDIVRSGLRSLIESEWGWAISGEATDGREAVAEALRLKPDVVVLDVMMPGLNGVDATTQIKSAIPDTEVLAFTGTDSEALMHQVFAAGALGYVLKSEAGQHLIPAIKALRAHEPYFTSRVSKAILESYLKGGIQAEQITPGGLTAREREIVMLLCDGRSNKEVGAVLSISVKTVEAHRAAIMRKLDCSAFSELVRYAVRNHIVPP